MLVSITILHYYHYMKNRSDMERTSMKSTKVGTAEKKTNRRKLEFYSISQNHLFETEHSEETLPQIFPHCPPSVKSLRTN